MLCALALKSNRKIMVRTSALIPAFSPGEKENRSPRFWNFVRRDWPDNFSPARNRATFCPLLGERKQVREVVNTNKEFVSAVGATYL